MQNLLDDYAQSNALRDTSPRLKLLLGLGAILLCVSSVTPIAPLFIAVTMSLVTIGLAKIPWRFYSKLLLIPLSFSLLSALVVAFMHGGGDQLISFSVFGFNLSISEDGANLALLLITNLVLGILARVFPQLNVFMLSFPLNIGIAFLVISLTLGGTFSVLRREFDTMGENILNIMHLLK